ncbi:MAG TPA: 30S ribosomal protein S6 [Clostridia bacterium]|nr:MAG: 30S ribosomal protein S6 [Clostridiales bacterium]HKL10402.1 30S ribosomal protein S6 [Clostridia bacterium]
MNKYEVLYIIKPNLEEEARKAVIEKFKGIVETVGEVSEINEWGIRKLAYEIQKLKEGYYVLMNFKAPEDLPMELERNFKISDDIMRYMVMKIEE